MAANRQNFFHESADNRAENNRRMKNSILSLLVIASLFLTAGGCEKHNNKEEVPEAVIVQFDNDHKDADDIYWEPTENGFQAKFDDGGIEKAAPV